jgi:putative hemolysin
MAAMDDVLTLAGGVCDETLTGRLRGPVRWIVERLPGVKALNALYGECERRTEPRFADRALETLGITLDANGLEHIPTSGPVVLVANHPTGALDGLALLSLVARRRADVRLVANGWLSHIPPLAADLVPVETIREGRRANARPMRAALRWLRGGHALVVFPAGTVSHVSQPDGASADSAWHAGAVRLARLAGAALVPCHIGGVNSALFHMAGRLSPWLRTALLPRELLRRRQSTLRVAVGRAVEPGDAADAEVTDRMRAVVYALPTAQSRAPGADAVAAEVNCLPADRTLQQTDDYAVFWCRASEAPRLLDAIGHAREATFRAAGEGTGAQTDLDRFDADYLHLCLWDRRAGELAGAYRMRVVEPDLPAESLYTNTLFDFDTRLVGSLAPGLELGRAFVVPAHQKRHQPLALLWGGIARFVGAHPEIRHLFGAVSVGATYSPAARAFLAAYLRRHALDRLRAPLVAPRHPLHVDAPRGTPVSPVDSRALSASLQSLDEEGKGVPVLLRQYLKLHARVLDFSVDPAFSDVLDVLVTVDLPLAPRTLLHRYMGEQAADAYLRHHAASATGSEMKSA